LPATMSWHGPIDELDRADVFQLPPGIRSLQANDQGGAAARWTAARQRAAAVARMSADPSSFPFPERARLHQEMLNRIAALEETIAKLPTSSQEQNKPRPLDDDEIEELKTEIARLKTLPPMPDQPLPDAIKAESKLRKFAEKVFLAMAADVTRAALNKLWETFGPQLIEVANAIARWIAG
jgi:hypothetical protein